MKDFIDPGSCSFYWLLIPCRVKILSISLAEDE